MGGAVGLKGTDGPALAEALRRGAQPSSSRRAAEALRELAQIGARLDVLTAGRRDGCGCSRAAGLSAVSVHGGPDGACTAEDTRRAAAAMREGGVDLILFAGGDGTARDVFAVVGTTTPASAYRPGSRCTRRCSGPARAMPAASPPPSLRTPARAPLHEAEIMDRDGPEDAARLFGYARTPYARMLVQPAKAISPTPEDADLDAACRQVARLIADDRYSFIGPGTTMRRIKRLLGAEGTLLGVDVFREGRIAALDVGEAELLAFSEERAARDRRRHRGRTGLPLRARQSAVQRPRDRTGRQGGDRHRRDRPETRVAGGEMPVRRYRRRGRRSHRCRDMFRSSPAPTVAPCSRLPGPERSYRGTADVANAAAPCENRDSRQLC